MVETDYNRDEDLPQNVVRNQGVGIDVESTPVSWIGNSYRARHNGAYLNSNDKCPIKVDISHPLWQTFLDSGTVSPLAFFRIFFSPPTYFNSPTPWRRSTR